MKSYLWIPFVLLVGLVIGAWGPRSELRQLRDEVKSLRKLADDSKKRENRFDDVARMLRISGTEANSVGSTTTKVDEKGGTNLPERLQEVGVTNEVLHHAQKDAIEGGRKGEEKMGMKERIEKAKEIWQLRSDMARSTFVSNTHLNEDETSKFDVLTEAMNMRLRDKISEWTQALKEGVELGPENGIRMVNDLTDVLVLTYNEMDGALPEKWRDNAGGDFDLTDFIDPSVAEPLIEVEGKLPSGRGRWGRGGFIRQGARPDDKIQKGSEIINKE